jgi:Phytanoyl-CoA dioxygenase (PhyH)
MRLFKRREGRGGGAGAAVAEPPAPSEAPVQGSTEEYDGSTEQLLAEIEELDEANHRSRSLQTELRLLRLRHLAGMRRLDEAAPNPEHPDPDATRLPESDSLPDIAASDLTPELIRSGILRDGALLVRGLIARDRALAFAAEIDTAFAERDKHDEGRPHSREYYDEFLPHVRFGPVDSRGWIKMGGGVLAADSPKLAYEMLDLYRSARVPELAQGYLGEPAVFSVHKTTLRKADPSVRGAWHQDGKFMGPVRALNLWVALSRCGDESPGLDIVPSRLEEYLPTGTDDAALSYQVAQVKVEEAAERAGKAIVRPIFEPGDAVFFDEKFLHATGSDPSMPKPRYAIENWFFGPSGFPDDYAPIAV